MKHTCGLPMRAHGASAVLHIILLVLVTSAVPTLFRG